MSLRKDQLEHPAIRYQTPIAKAIVEWGVNYSAQPFTVEGQDNLDRARRMMEQSGSWAFTPNHTSNGDGPVVERALVENGVPDAAYILGRRLLTNPATRHLTTGVTHIPIWPPTETPKNDQEEHVRGEMNKVARSAASAVLVAHHPLVVFIEGGRSYGGGLKQPNPQVVVLFDQETVVTPVGISGLFENFPHKRILPSRGPVAVRFGEPRFMSEIKKRHAGEGKEERRQGVVDDIMLGIRDVLPERYHGAYTGR